MILSEFFIVLLGLIIGSFLNVCIARIPEGESVIFPNSHCPVCRSPIKSYDNIPLVSFIMLRGRCRECKVPISWQYPVVEGLTGLTFWGTFHLLGLQGKSISLLIFFSAIIVLVFIDLNHRILPDVITLPGAGVGLISSLFIPVGDGTSKFLLGLMGYSAVPAVALSFLDALLGAFVCSGFLWLVARAYFWIREIEGLGLGDVKLMGMVGAFLGMRLGLLTIMLGSFMGAVIGLIYIKAAGKENNYELPFGSFLGLAAIISALRGAQMIGQYVSLFPIF